MNLYYDRLQACYIGTDALCMNKIMLYPYLSYFCIVFLVKVNWSLSSKALIV